MLPRSAPAIALLGSLVAGVGHAEPTTAELIGTAEQRQALLTELTTRILEREAFSPHKGEDFPERFRREADALAPLFASADTEAKLLRALTLLSNLRRDGHLRVQLVRGGLRWSGPPDAVPPVTFAPDFGVAAEDDDLLFVDDLDEKALREAGVAELPARGDRLLAIEGEPVAARLRRIAPYLACSTRERLRLELAVNVAARRADFPPELSGEAVTLDLERPDGERYRIRAPMVPLERPAWDEPLDFLRSNWLTEPRRYRGFSPHLETPSFTLWLPEESGRKVALLEWHDFKDDLRQDVERMMELASTRGLFDHGVILDLTRSRGGSNGWYLLRRLAREPFRMTRSNLRASDASAQFIELQLAAPPRPEREWLRQWLLSEARVAIAAGRPYTASAPFKLAALPPDSDGVLAPQSPHFRGELVLLVGPFARSQNDQLAAMVADNRLGRLIGMATAGTSNSWEWSDPIRLPGGRREIARFTYSIGQTLRPTGEVLEGNPPAPDEWVPRTRENFELYHDELVERALRWLERDRPPAARSPS